MTSPDEREDYHGVEGDLTENHCDREDCRGRIEQLEADLAEARFDLSMVLKVVENKDEHIDDLRGLIKAQGRVISFLDSKNDSLEQKTQYWPDNAERDAVIRHQKEVIERLREALLSFGAQAGDIRAMLEPRG